MLIGPDDADVFKPRIGDKGVRRQKCLVAERGGQRLVRFQAFDESRTEKALTEGALWIGVHQQNPLASLSQMARQMKACGTLAASTFLIDEANDDWLHSPRCRQMFLRRTDCHWQFPAKPQEIFEDMLPQHEQGRQGKT